MNNNRRDFLKKAAYVAPVVLTMTAVPAFASSGSAPPGNRPPGNRPPGNRPPENRPPENRPPD